MKVLLTIWIGMMSAVVVSAQSTINYQVILRSDFGQDTLWDGNAMKIYALTPTLGAIPTIPAKTLYANEGDTVIITARSVAQGHHHTIHLHGLDVDTRNDGDPATSFWLSHMQDTTYTFIARHAGTYLYHCHVGDVVHVQMGMYGLVVVKAAGGAKTTWTGGPSFNSYRNWLMSEIDEAWHDNVPQHDSTNTYIQLPLYLPNYFLINGKSEQEVAADDSISINGAQNEVIYMRLGNIGFFDNRIVFPPALQARIIDSDGRPLPAEVISDTLWISPGERYGVLLSPQSQFVDSVSVSYVNMNTQQVWNTQFVPVNISGFFGVEEDVSVPLRIHPNPTAGNVSMNIPFNVQAGAVRVTDVVGNVVVSQTAENGAGSITLDLRVLPAGLYLVELQYPGQVFTGKVMVSP